MRKQILKYIEKKSKVDLGELAVMLGSDVVTIANEIAAMEEDFQNTLTQCCEMSVADYKKQKLRSRIAGKFLRMLSPLM